MHLNLFIVHYTVSAQLLNLFMGQASSRDLVPIAYASIEGSDVSANPHSLVRAVAAHIHKVGT